MRVRCFIVRVPHLATERRKRDGGAQSRNSKVECHFELHRFIDASVRGGPYGNSRLSLNVNIL
jgi:hypothetical protein